VVVRRRRGGENIKHPSSNSEPRVKRRVTGLTKELKVEIYYSK
jgi:hypothetical protein